MVVGFFIHRCLPPWFFIETKTGLVITLFKTVTVGMKIFFCFFPANFVGTSKLSLNFRRFNETCYSKILFHAFVQRAWKNIFCLFWILSSIQSIALHTKLVKNLNTELKWMVRIFQTHTMENLSKNTNKINNTRMVYDCCKKYLVGPTGVLPRRITCVSRIVAGARGARAHRNWRSRNASSATVTKPSSLARDRGEWMSPAAS